MLGTPEGAPFEMIHVMGADRDEIYFAVRRRVGRTVAESYEIIRERTPVQYPGATFSGLEPRELAGHPAHEFTFRWDDQVRHVVLVAVGDAVYRILFRPGSEVNWAILDTVTISG